MTSQTEAEKGTAPPVGAKVRFISLRWKLIFWFSLLFSVAFGVAFYWFFTFAENLALNKIEDDLVNTLIAAADGVDGDVMVALSHTGEANADGFSDDPRYNQLMDWLDTVHKIEPRSWPYLFVVGESSKEGIFVADLSARYNPDRSSLFMESYTSDRDVPGIGGLELRQENGKLASYADKWGRWVSAYAPVKNAAGETVGAIGIDFEANYVDFVRSSILDTIAVAFAVTYASIFVLVLLISDMLIRPIRKLTGKAARIGEGDYEQDLSYVNDTRLRDEIGVLADVFTAMIEKVYQREQRLLVEVSKLRIEIDETKRQKQISEIVDTDFFRELQSKANTMRQRRIDRQSSSD
jgi:hypothetical protein